MPATTDTEVRSEMPSLSSLEQALLAIKGTSDTEELATLLLTVAELYADGECRCEEKGSAYGENSPEARSCWLGVNRSRDKMLEAYRYIVRELKGK